MARYENEIMDFTCYAKVIQDIKGLDNATTNIFKILRQETYETKHSIFLGWLFNSLASHGLGNSFAKEFFNVLDEKKNLEKEKRIDDIKVVDVFLEKRIDGSDRRIDILIVGENFTCTIENKYGSAVHDMQCHAYKEYIEGKYKGYNNRFVYLDITKPNDFDDNHEENYANYELILYKDIAEILNKLKKEKEIEKPQGTFIEQYIEILEERAGNDQSQVYMEACKGISLKDLIAINNLTEEDCMDLEYDQKRFVDVAKIGYTQRKDKIDNKIKDCLISICQDKHFFKDNYGNQREMYANTIPIVIDCLDIPDYLYKRGAITAEELAQLRRGELEHETKLSNRIRETKREIKKDKGIQDRNTRNIPFQTIDYEAPNNECENIRIMLYAGFKPIYSQYMCQPDSFCAKKLFELENNGWIKTVKFYVRTGAGVSFLQRDDTREPFKITLEIRNIDDLQKVYNKEAQGIFGSFIPREDILNENKILKDYLDSISPMSTPNVSIYKLLRETVDSRNCNRVILGCEIDLQYVIKPDKPQEDWSAEYLQRTFYEKTIEVASVFGYDEWFKDYIFKKNCQS